MSVHLLFANSKGKQNATIMILVLPDLQKPTLSKYKRYFQRCSGDFLQGYGLLL